MAWLFVFLSAFEFSCGSGPAGAMLAGGAVADWRHGLWHNPALVDTFPGAGAAAVGCRPYGLEGLTWATTALHFHHRRWGASLGAGSMALGRFRESDVQVVLAGSPAARTWLGVGTHVLLLNPDGVNSDFALSFDVGGWYAPGRFALGAAAASLNRPRWQDDEEQPARLTLSVAWQLVDELLVAADVIRQAGNESVACGTEFRLAPPLCLRAGVLTAPLQYAGGLGVRVGVLGFDYAWRFHPQLKGTHVAGLSLAWH